MLYMTMTAATLGLVLAASVAVLLRRERRQRDSGLDALPNGAVTAQGIRDVRRQARVRRHFATLGSLRDRDWG
ncbi:hypothetical protein ACFY93_14225 [Streptomyces sp. NPDC008313]|uniref:hypothetical protein n=1 Tax=Streptomyces sp. NPDC008313 TaxID=3364826 RepID=UPI0036EAE668